MISPGSAAPGCEQVDKQFTGFSYSNSGISVPGSTVDATFGGTAPTTITANFASSGWDTEAAGQTTSSSVGYTATVDPAYTTPGGPIYEITAIRLAANYTYESTNNTTDNLTVIEYFCGGGASACAGGTPGVDGGLNPNAKTFGYMQFQLLGSTTGGSFNNTICFNNGGTTCTPTASGTYISFTGTEYASGFSSIYISNAIAVTSGGSQVQLNSFTDTLYESLITPEPSTFGLLGSALLALGMLRFRKRKSF